jgi:hypothetical protein
MIFQSPHKKFMPIILKIHPFTWTIHKFITQTDVCHQPLTALAASPYAATAAIAKVEILLSKSAKLFGCVSGCVFGSFSAGLLISATEITK